MSLSKSIERYGSRATNERLARKGEVVAITRLSDTTIWRREKEGRFPARIRLTPRTTVWRMSDIERWLADPENYQQEFLREAS